MKGLNSLFNEQESHTAEKSRFLFPNKMFDMVSGKRILGLVVAAACLACYSWLLRTNLCDVAGGADSSGYVNFAWRLRHGGLVEQIKGVDTLGLSEEFVPLFYPLGFTQGSKSRTMVPQYPAGLLSRKRAGWAWLSGCGLRSGYACPADDYPPLSSAGLRAADEAEGLSEIRPWRSSVRHFPGDAEPGPLRKPTDDRISRRVDELGGRSRARQAHCSVR